MRGGKNENGGGNKECEERELREGKGWKWGLRQSKDSKKVIRKKGWSTNV